MASTSKDLGVKAHEMEHAAGKAKADAQEVASTMSAAASAVGAMASQAAASVGAMASQAASDVGKQVGKQADDLTASAGAGIQGLGDRFSKSAPSSGMLGTASQAVAKTVKESGQYLENAKLSGMSEDVANIIRRNPLPAILIAFTIGWFLASKLKSR